MTGGKPKFAQINRG